MPVSRIGSTLTILSESSACWAQAVTGAGRQQAAGHPPDRLLQKRATSRSEPAEGASHACPFCAPRRAHQVAGANRSSLYRVTTEADAKLRAQVPSVTSSSALARPPWWLSLPVLTAAYLGAVWLGLQLVVEPEQIAIFWPASGLALGVLLAIPKRRWPSILAAWFVAHAAAELAYGVQIIEALAYPAIALGEVTLGASLALRTTGARASWTLTGVGCSP